MDPVVFLSCALAASIVGNVINVWQIHDLRETCGHLSRELRLKHDQLSRVTRIIYERLGSRQRND